MTKDEILLVLRDTVHREAHQTAAFDYFVKEMEDRQYGQEALVSAWEFFASGFYEGVWHERT